MKEEKIGKVYSTKDAKKAFHTAWPYILDPDIPHYKTIMSEKRSFELLKGMVDVHCHGAPEAWHPERPSVLQTCIDASLLGMKAVVFKDHDVNTSYGAYIIQEYLDQRAEKEEGFTPARIFGSVTLNHAVGGLNPVAVFKALSNDYGKVTKTIWMPSISSQWQKKHMGEDGGITIIENGKIKPEVKEIIKLVANAPTKVSISTSHISVEESMILVDECTSAGVDSIACHATQELTVLTLDEAKEMMARGAWIEISATSVIGTPLVGAGMGINWKHSLELIETLGPSRIILSTDAGQPAWEPVVAARLMLRILASYGVSEDELNTMCKTNPSKLLDIS